MTIVPGILLAFMLLPVGLDRPAGPRNFAFFEPVRPPRALQVMAHRGAMRQAPENTAPALERSIADTVEWVEVDVRLTKDGEHVLFHDDQLSNKTDGTGRVRDRTLAELRALDAGTRFAARFARTRILTLIEGLRLARGRVNLYLDCKEIDPAKLASAVIAAGMEHQVVIYDTPEALEAVRAAATRELAFMTKWRPRFGIAPWVNELRLAAIEIDAGDVTPDVCREFKSRGIKVQAKTLGADDRSEVWDRMAAAGVDWIQTDFAEEVIAHRAIKTMVAKPIKIAHHRGASRYAPENTLPALEKAIRLGADFVEFDVQTTRDGGFVLLHDRTLNRTTNGRAGSWFGQPFAGTPVLTLDEFLKAADRRVELYVDAKDIAPEALAEALKRHGLVERAVVYQSVAYLEKLRAIDPKIRRMPPLRDPARLDSAVERAQPYAFDTNWSILSKELIDRCHAKGIKVFSDALGSHERIEDYQRAIRDGIDLIQTDHPIRVLRAIELLDDVTVVHDIAYREGASRQWRLDLAMKENTRGSPRPGIVVIHGGGWIEGDKSSFASREHGVPGNIVDFAALGFVAVTINYRLSGEAPFPAALEDCKCAVRWLRAHAKEYNLDPARIGAFGNSAGGHLAMLLGMIGKDAGLEGDGPYQDQSSLVQAVVSDSGPIDLGEQYRSGVLREVCSRFMGGPPEEARADAYKSASPSDRITPQTPPLLLIYGVDDAQVPVETADRFVLALARAGLRDVSYCRLAHVDHCPYSLIRVPAMQPVVNEFFIRTLVPAGRR
jgi:glycerophosphoryl diester phosphodiesterase